MEQEEKAESRKQKPETRNLTPETPLTFEVAKDLPQQGRVAGLKVKGSYPPFGGSWRYDSSADELTLTDPPTATP